MNNNRHLAEPNILSSSEMSNAKLVIMGRVGSVYGVRGWLKVISFTEPKENILTYSPWYLRREGNWQRFEIQDGRQHGKLLIVQFQGCTDREAARVYTNADIAVMREQLPALNASEYYWTDLEGLTVITTTGRELGVVDHLFATGANDVLVVKGDKQHLLPYIPEQVIVEIDLKNKIMRVDWEWD